MLAIKICDPACGSGHFLIAAAQRLTRRLANIRAGDEEPSPELFRHTLREVISHCLYGVDINPMAVELCKVGLWLEGMEPGKPLSFLDHHIQCGNALIGATPELVASGIPDAAFTFIKGDDKTICREAKKRNKEELTQLQLFHGVETHPWERLGNLPTAMIELENMAEESVSDIQLKESRYAELVRSTGYLGSRLLADTWCAAFVWKKTSEFSYCITNEILRRIEKNPYDCPAWMRNEILRLAAQYQFFHWHLAFPEVFAPQKAVPIPAHSPDVTRGFDCILGNPPWERVKLQEKEWFAERRPEIANASNAATRKRMIESLNDSDPMLYQQFLEDSRKAEGESHLLRNSGHYPLCGRGDINLYTVFAEKMRNLLNVTGRVGAVLPTGIATDDTTKYFFQDIIEKKSLASLFDFENSKGLFPHVQGNIKFCLLTLSNLPVKEFVIAAQLNDPLLLNDSMRTYRLTILDIRIVNPNTLNCPTFRFTTDALIVKAIHRRHPILVYEGGASGGNRWHINFATMFHMTNDSSFFKTLEDLNELGANKIGNIFYIMNEKYLPLYEAKLVHQFNHRAATFEGIPVADRFKIHAGTSTPSELDIFDPNWVPLPRFWIPAKEIEKRCTNKNYILSGFRNAISATADSRSLVATILPWVGVGNSLPLFHTELGADVTMILTAVFNSFVTDYILRQKASGGNLNFYILKQIPVINPDVIHQTSMWESDIGTIYQWLLSRILELTYTAWDLNLFTENLLKDVPAISEWEIVNCDEGFASYWRRYSNHSPFTTLHSPPPFRWDDGRRFLLRCELDAAFFHLYLSAETNGEWKIARKERGAVCDETDAEFAALKCHFPTPRHAVDYIMDMFPIVKRKDEARWGEYRTKRVILEIYDAMQDAILTGNPYQTRLDPPPADPRCCHSEWGIS